MHYFYTTMPSPVGELTLIASDKGVAGVLWATERDGHAALKTCQLMPDHRWLKETQRQLVEYFAGERCRFDLPLDTQGTPFQKQVWAALQTIPYGQTSSYAQIASQVGSPKAVRAVGAANGRNPVSIIVPCHRVIGSNGKLTGFAGGLEVKAFLLKLEANRD